MLYDNEPSSYPISFCIHLFLQSVQVSDVKRVMNNYVWSKNPVVAAVGPTEGLPDYSNIKEKMKIN